WQGRTTPAPAPPTSAVGRTSVLLGRRNCPPPDPLCFGTHERSDDALRAFRLLLLLRGSLFFQGLALLLVVAGRRCLVCHDLTIRSCEALDIGTDAAGGVVPRRRMHEPRSWVWCPSDVDACGLPAGCCSLPSASAPSSISPLRH